MRERKKNRLVGYDYSHPGAYFVTLCIKNRECLFGEIVGAGLKPAQTKLNEYGEIANECWVDLPKHYTHCQLDDFVIMPNHVHGIIHIVDFVGNGLKPFPTTDEKQHGLPEIIRGFKTFSSRRINQFDSGKRFQWQKSYNDRIIRNDDELNRIREYINNNPANWGIDQDNPG